MMHVLAAPDKFRGSATAPEVAAAVAAGVAERGGCCVELPLADGGEGTLDAFGGANRASRVTGPLGGTVTVGWRIDATGRAVVEMARASGLQVAGGPARNDPIAATTRGTGEVIATAIRAGATRVLVGMGGSATTDGGAGAVEVLAELAPFIGVEVLVCCDVSTPFVGAARVFGPQKGASPEQVEQLTARLHRLQRHYRQRFGVDLAALPGAGAAGGLAGGLAALGARLVPGFGVIAAELGVEQRVAEADLVVTGEGKLDSGSFDGKVVGNMAALADTHGKDLFVVAGMIDAAARGRVPAVSLSERYGRQASFDCTTDCIRRAVAEHLATR